MLFCKRPGVAVGVDLADPDVPQALALFFNSFSPITAQPQLKSLESPFQLENIFIFEKNI